MIIGKNWWKQKFWSEYRSDKAHGTVFLFKMIRLVLLKRHPITMQTYTIDYSLQYYSIIWYHDSNTPKWLQLVPVA